MRTLFPILILFGLVASASAQSTNRITAKITVTTATSNNFAFTLNGNTRVFTNSVTAAASQITTNHTVAGSASNFYYHVVATPFTGPVVPLNYTNGSNVIFLRGALGQAMSVTILSNWATVEYSTQVFSSGLIDVRVPMASVAPAERVKVASELVTGINAYTTNAFATNSPALTNHLSLGPQPQTAANKVFNTSHLTGSAVSNSYLTNITRANVGELRATNISATSGTLSNATLLNAVAYNFNSPGSGSDSLQLGTNSNASGSSSLAIGASAGSSGSGGTAIGVGATNTGINGIALGSGTWVLDDTGIGVGVGNVVQGYGGVAIGNGIGVTNDYVMIFAPGSGGSFNSSSFGPMAANQVWIGSSSESVWIPGATHFARSIFFTNAWATNITIFNGSAKNVTFTGTNVVNARVDFTSRANSALANGNNSGIVLGSNVYVRLSGPSGAYTNAGFVAEQDGSFHILQFDNPVNNMTLLDASGLEVVPANRILLSGVSGGSLNFTNNPVLLPVIYDGTASRWRVLTGMPYR